VQVLGQEGALAAANKFLPAVNAANTGGFDFSSGQLVVKPQAPVNAPMIVTPTFNQADEQSKGLTKGGILLSLFKAGLQGGLDGMGGDNFQEGSQLARQGPFQRRHQNQQLEQEDLASQAQRQAIEQAPVLFKSRLDSAAAQAAADKARAALYDDRAATPNRVVAGGRLLDRDTGEVVTDAPAPSMIFRGTPATGVAVGNPRTGEVKTAISPNPKPKPQAKVDKSPLYSKAASTAATFLNAHSGDVNAALADFNSQIDGKQVDHADLVLAAIKKGAGKVKK
jgi:hypothetical protein